MRHELPCFFLLCDDVAVECDGISVVGCEVSSEERVLIAPKGDPDNIECKCGLFSIAGEYGGEVLDGEVVIVYEDDFEGAEVSEVREGGEVVVGEVELDEVEALGEGRDVDGEWSMQNEQFERLVFRDEFLEGDCALTFASYYIH